MEAVIIKISHHPNPFNTGVMPLQAPEQRSAFWLRRPPWRGLNADHTDGAGSQCRNSIGLVDIGEAANFHRHGRLIHDA